MPIVFERQNLPYLCLRQTKEGVTAHCARTAAITSLGTSFGARGISKLKPALRRREFHVWK